MRFIGIIVINVGFFPESLFHLPSVYKLSPVHIMMGDSIRPLKVERPHHPFPAAICHPRELLHRIESWKSGATGSGGPQGAYDRRDGQARPQPSRNPWLTGTRPPAQGASSQTKSRSRCVLGWVVETERPLGGSLPPKAILSPDRQTAGAGLPLSLIPGRSHPLALLPHLTGNQRSPHRCDPAPAASIRATNEPLPRMRSSILRRMTWYSVPAESPGRRAGPKVPDEVRKGIEPYLSGHRRVRPPSWSGWSRSGIFH